jgi:hypothetical protein
MSGAADIETASKAPAKKHWCKSPWMMLLMLIAITGGTVGGVLGGIFGASGDWIKGTWVTNFGSYITITDGLWISVSSWGTTVYTIDSINNGNAIMQNPASDAYNPSLWTKVEFHKTEGDNWGYCSSVYNGASKQAAIDTDTKEIYDSTDAAAGCNGFGHTVSSPYASPLLGSWSDNWGITITINATHWKSEASWGTSTYSILAYGASFYLMQNPSDDAYNPDKWTVVQFHPSTAGGSVANGFGYCMAVYNGASAKAAMEIDTATIYDASNAASGCNGFGHSVASPA